MAAALPMTIKTKEGIKITVKEGCVTKESADVIINSTTDKLNLDAGTLSSSILKAAGSEIQVQCKEKSPGGITRGHVVDTTAGKLPANVIYHGSLSPWMSGNGEKDLLAFIRCFLDKADIEGKTSMAIPAITTGVLEFPPNVVARVMYEEIKKFSKANPRTTLKDIRIILFSDPAKAEFTKYFSDIVSEIKSHKDDKQDTGAAKATQRPSSAWAVQRVFSAMLGSGLASVPVNEQESDTQTDDILVSFVTKESITVNIKKGSIAEAETDVIVNVTTKDLRLGHGAISSSILKAAGNGIKEECAKNAPNGIKYGEVAETSGGSLKCDSIYHGAVQQWTSGSGENDLRTLMTTILNKAENDNKDSISFPCIGTGLILGYPADKVAQYMVEEIENFSSRHPAASVDTVDIVLFQKDKRSISAFKTFVTGKYNVSARATDDTTREKTKVEIPMPDSWSKMASDELYKLVDLSTSSDEYKTVSKRFTDKGGSQTIIKIQRVQCPNMYQLFLVRLGQIDKAITDKKKFPPERTLYHGTSQSSLDSINLLGFNRAYGGKNATMLGYGTYFAADASYSCSGTYSPRDSSGHKHVYQCRVLTGEYTQGKSDLKVPPAKDPHNPTVLYDTVVNNVSNPTVFVVFYDAQAYPEYLITFKDK